MQYAQPADCLCRRTFSKHRVLFVARGLAVALADGEDGANQQAAFKLACHYDESSECAHVVGINEVACYRTERTLMGCADPLLRGSVHLEGGSAHPISVLELTKDKVVGWSCHWPTPVAEGACDASPS